MNKLVTSRKIISNNPPKVDRILTLQEFYNRRNKILIIRAVGGLGDIFMHRMMFEDFKLIAPDAEIHFACPLTYHDAVIDHPFIDRVLDSATVDKTEYVISYNTTTACGRYEMRIAPKSDLNRSDIWAAHCGIKLTKHNMHIQLTDAEKEWGRETLKSYSRQAGPIALICPVSAMENKNLQDYQLETVVNHLRSIGCSPVGLHYVPVLGLVNRNVPMICKVNLRQWMAVINQADYVVSVDTSAFHCAGGMGKPLTGIFTFADGLVYGEHYDFVLVQKHHATDPSWTCGPCYDWCNCIKTKLLPKPCLTEISREMLISGIDKMIQKWNISN